MRGKVVSHMPATAARRITPAYAGKSEPVAGKRKIDKDHPRLCGEKQRGDITGMSFMGSPPPMRGKEAIRSGEIIAGRITPAYAGKSIITLPCLSKLWDHPRLCGEKKKVPSVGIFV